MNYWLAAKLWSFETKQFFLRNVPQRTLIFSHDCHFSAESALLDPDCIATTITQAYPNFSKVLDNPLKKKALKRNKTLATQLCSYIGYSFRQPNQLLSFQKCHTGNNHTSPKCEFCTQANNSLQIYWKTISDTGNDKDQSIEFQKSGTSWNSWRIVWAIPN